MGSELLRRDDLEVHSVEDGLVVYDPRSDRVHYLNHTAGIVLEMCDGKTTPARIAELIGEAYELSEPPRKEVGECVVQLIEEGLVARPEA
jgi:hypothetical protein